MSKPKPVNQIDLKTNKIIKTWTSVSEAKKQGGYNFSRIILVCQEKAYSSNGFGWSYANKKPNQVCGRKKRETIPVIYYDFSKKKEKTFISTRAAAEHFNTTTNLVRVYACATNKFVESKRNIPKYFSSGTFVYDIKENKKTLLERFKTLEMECKVCFLRFTNLKALSTHIQMAHNVCSSEYTLKYLYDGERPRCKKKKCEKETKYVSFGYKQYCLSHTFEAMKIGGIKGGKAQAWNKGLTKNTDTRILKQAISLMGENNPFFRKTHNKETIKKIILQKTLRDVEINSRLKKFEKYYEFDCDIEAYTKREKFIVATKCKKCGFKENKRFVNIERGSLCKKCYPFTTSKAELEIGDYIESLGIEISRNNRKIISPYELDIFAAKHNFAIEYNGLYWHMDRGQKTFNKNLHKIKLSLCKNKEIRLLHIFGDEWQNNKDLVKSMICHALNKTSNKLNARSSKIVELNSEETETFFSQNHISGNVKCHKAFGLSIDNTIVSAISLRYPFHKKKYPNHIEIARFATKKHTVVRGGFSKLIKEVQKWCKQQNINKIISYCDLSSDAGNVYYNNGFTLAGEAAELNYWYTDGVNRYNRFKFRAKGGKSEKQIAKENGVFRIYGCGNLVFTKTITCLRKTNIMFEVDVSNLLYGDINPVAYGSTKMLKWREHNLSSKLVFEMSVEEREELAKAVFEFYRTNGFPYIVHEEKTLLKEWSKLQKENLVPKQEDGFVFLPNKQTGGNKLVQHFNSKQFYTVKGNGNKDRSMLEAFNDDEILMKVIRNRLQITFDEPFNIHGAMLRQGFRSTRMAAVTSTFNCLVAKYIYTELTPENGTVFDYSAGFGHRMLGALASQNNLKYIACDPWTSVVKNNKEMADFIQRGNRVKIWNCGSEIWSPPSMLRGNVDLAFSSPPYFDKEIYDSGKNGQAYENRTFENFLEEWWIPTLSTIQFLLKPGGLLVINMVEPMINDLLKVAYKMGFAETKRYHLQMSRSHFEKAKKFGDKAKSKFKAEPIVVLKYNT